MRELTLKSEIDFWKVKNNNVEYMKYKQMKKYPNFPESKYINYIFLKGNLLYHSEKGLFELSSKSNTYLERKIYLIIQNTDFEESNIAISNDTLDKELIIEFNILKYLALKKLKSKEIEEILKKYDVFTYFSVNDSDSRKLAIGCKVLALIIFIYQNKNFKVIEDFSEYIKFRSNLLNSNPIELDDSRKDIELSYDYYRVFTEIYNLPLNKYGSDLITKILKCFFDLEFRKSEDRYCFRSENTEFSNVYNNFDYMYFGNKETNGVKDLINKIFDNIRDAVNDNKEAYKYKSYSKALCVPLFKYIGDKGSPNPSLIMKKLRINSISINVVYDLFYWFEDLDGNRYVESYLTDSQLDLEIFLNKELLFKHLYQNLDVPSMFIVEEKSGDLDYLLDIDDIRMQICNFTFDISELKRQALDEYYESNENSAKFKRMASYKKDREVISTEPFSNFDDLIISNQETIVFIRLLYIIKIYNINVKYSLKEMLEKAEEIIEFSKQDKLTIIYICRYINLKIGFERRTFNEIVNLNNVSSNEILTILNSTIKFSNVNKELPKKLVEIFLVLKEKDT